MHLWLKSTSAESRPKWLGGDNANAGKKEDCFATSRGWEMKAGTPATGNGNSDADPEILVAMGGLSTTLAAPNCLSVDWTAGEYARGETFDMVTTWDEAITVTSAAWSGNNTVTNKWHFEIENYGPTDMANDGSMQMQYFAGTGTNKITFRGTIPSTAVASGLLGDGDYALTLNGTATAVDGNGTTVGAVKLAGGSANCGPGADAEIMANTVKKTGSTVNTEETTSGTSSGTAQTLVGVTTAVS